MKFTIGFEKEDTRKLHDYWDDIIGNQQWSEGKFTGIFEEKWSFIISAILWLRKWPLAKPAM